MTKSIAIIGLGVLGSAIAKFLLENGFQVYGFDISKKALANFNNNEKFYACSSVDEIFHKESNILSCLPSACSLYEVMQAIPKGDQSEKNKRLLIELSTLPVDSKEKAREIAQKKKCSNYRLPLVR